MAKKNTKYPWQDKICNHNQIGGIETSVIDDGLGRGNRIAWINTGSGLHYKVVIDRAMDIAETFFNQHSLCWLSHGGFTAPRPDANRGLEWLYSFGGGLLTTCGLTHIGGPDADETEERGLHGRISNIPALIESIVQPDPVAGNLSMSITGVMKQTKLFGPNLELRRTISGTLGKSTIRIVDVVTNLGSEACPHMILYHHNFGWPLADQGSVIVFKGRCKSRGSDDDNAIFNKDHDYRICQGPLESHRGGGEAAGFINVTTDSKGFCSVGIANRKINLAVVIKYKKNQLPSLTNWQCWGFGDYVTGIEPGTNPPIGQIAAKKQKKLIKLAPGESRSYDLELSVLANEKRIDKFITTFGK